MRKFEGYVHGIDLGGWLSQCDYSQDRLDNFIKKSDIEKIKSWGLDHVRVPVDYNIFQSDDGKLIERGFECVQRCIDWCGEVGLNMILDLHKTRGFSFDKGEGEKNFFDDGQLQQAFYDLWEEFSRRYVKYADRLAFELLNEVTDQSYIDSWNRISGEAIKVIRKYSRDVKIIVGSYWNNSLDAMKDLAPPADENIVYTFHCYDPLIFTHQGAYWVDEMPRDFRLEYPSTVANYEQKYTQIGLDKHQRRLLRGKTTRKVEDKEEGHDIKYHFGHIFLCCQPSEEGAKGKKFDRYDTYHYISDELAILVGFKHRMTFLAQFGVLPKQEE